MFFRMPNRRFLKVVLPGLAALVSISFYGCGLSFKSTNTALLALGTGKGHGGNSGAGGTNAATLGITPSGQQTVSNWLGTNISGDFPYNDVTHLLQPFTTNPAGQIDANGYPLAGVSGTSSTDAGFLFYTGDYKISYQGTGTLQISGGAAALVGGWTQVGNEQRGVLHFTWTPGQFGVLLNLNITNQPGQTVTGIHIYLPGVDYDTPALFSSAFLRSLTPFKQMRFMDWMGGAGGSVVNFTDMQIPYTTFGSAHSIDAIIELINTTGKDAWVNIPQYSNQNFWNDFGTYLIQHLDYGRINTARALQGDTTPFHIIVEYANETWAIALGGAGNSMATIAASNPSRYDGAYSGEYGAAWFGTNVFQAAQVSVDLLIKSSTAIKRAFASIGHPETIQTVFSGWTIAPQYTAAGLEFVVKNYGPAKQYIDYIGAGTYFTPADQSGALSNIFLGFNGGIDSTISSMVQFKGILTEYGVQMASYEGGSGLNGSSNVHNELLANYDARMYSAYAYFFQKWKENFGEARMNHYSLADTLGTPESSRLWGFWFGLTSVLDDPAICSVNVPELTESDNEYTLPHYCPKYRAFFEQVGN